MKLVKVLILPIIIGLVVMGCTIFGGGKAELTVSLTDAPAIAADELNITFGSIAVSMPDVVDEDEWITINENGGTFNILDLTNGKLQSLGVAELPAGLYGQIRFYVDKAEVVVGSNTYNVTVNSGTVKLTGGFELKAGIDAQIVVDFDASHSLKLIGTNTYTLTPVVHMALVSETGSAGGTLDGTYSNPVTVSAWIDYDAANTSAIPESATIVADDGTFLLGYLNPGTYDITFESEGFDILLIESVTITQGENTTIVNGDSNYSLTAIPN